MRPMLLLSPGSKVLVGFESLIFGAEENYARVARVVVCDGDNDICGPQTLHRRGAPPSEWTSAPNLSACGAMCPFRMGLWGFFARVVGKDGYIVRNRGSCEDAMPGKRVGCIDEGVSGPPVQVEKPKNRPIPRNSTLPDRKSVV